MNQTVRRLQGDSGLGRPAVGNFVRGVPRRDSQREHGLEDRGSRPDSASVFLWVI